MGLDLGTDILNVFNKTKKPITPRITYKHSANEDITQPFF